MHLGYHELRKMLALFKEEREKRKMAPPATVPGGASAMGSRSDRDPRKDEYRDRERGHSARYECVLFIPSLYHSKLMSTTIATDGGETGSVRDHPDAGGIRPSQPLIDVFRSVAYHGLFCSFISEVSRQIRMKLHVYCTSR